MKFTGMPRTLQAGLVSLALFITSGFIQNIQSIYQSHEFSSVQIGYAVGNSIQGFLFVGLIVALIAKKWWARIALLILSGVILIRTGVLLSQFELQYLLSLFTLWLPYLALIFGLVCIFLKPSTKWLNAKL